MSAPTSGAAGAVRLAAVLTCWTALAAGAIAFTWGVCVCFAAAFAY